MNHFTIIVEQSKKLIVLLYIGLSTATNNLAFSETLQQGKDPLAINKLVSNMKIIPEGKFQMGCVGEQACHHNEKPVHWVNVSSFKMMATEVTFAMWQACVESNGCNYQPKYDSKTQANYPVNNVSFDDITEQFIPWLNKLTQSIGEKKFALPSEAQWEYAARAGSKTKYYWGNEINCSHARYGYLSNECGKQKSANPVQSYDANPFGLYDMLGNVWEWIQDCSNYNYIEAPTDGSAWLEGGCDYRVLRGGSWYDEPNRLRLSKRYWDTTTKRFNSTHGFRLVKGV